MTIPFLSTFPRKGSTANRETEAQHELETHSSLGVAGSPGPRLRQILSCPLFSLSSVTSLTNLGA